MSGKIFLYYYCIRIDIVDILKVFEVFASLEMLGLSLFDVLQTHNVDQWKDRLIR